MRSFFSSLIVLGALLVASAASAQEAPSAGDIKKAAAAFDRGRESFRNESYVEAAEHFEAADSHAPSAASMRLAIASRKAAEQLARAATLAALAVEQYPDDATLQEEAQAVLDEAQPQLGRVYVDCDEPCELLLDGKLVHGQSANNRQLYVNPGDHRLQASWSDDRVLSESFSVGEGSSTDVEFYAPLMEETGEAEGEPLDEPADESVTDTQPDEVDEGGGWSPAVFWTGAGVTALGIGLSSWLGVKAINEPGTETVRTECTGQGVDCPEYQQGLANQRNANIAIGATTAVGAFTIVTGIWLTDWSGGGTKEASPEPEDDVWSYRRGDFSVRPLFAVGDGATVGAVGTF